MSKKMFLNIFPMAMKSLLQEFDQIEEFLIQREIIYMIGITGNTTLLPCLEEFLKKNDNLDPMLIEEIEEAISSLKLALKREQLMAKKSL